MKIDLNKYDDGLGAAYERFAIAKAIERDVPRGSRLLELNATFIGGVPGFNSYLLQKHGYEVEIAVPARDYEDTKNVWSALGLLNDINIIKLEKTTKSGLKSGEYDLVWNHLVFEQYTNPRELVTEMTRLSRGYVMAITLNPYNIGYWLHRLHHKFQRHKWDHGKVGDSTIGAMKKAFVGAGMSVLTADGLDVPPWLDTVDMQIGGTMSYVKNTKRDWIWSVANSDFDSNKTIKRLYSMELMLPRWFRILMAHHLYILGSKEKK